MDIYIFGLGLLYNCDKMLGSSSSIIIHVVVDT